MGDLIEFRLRPTEPAPDHQCDPEVEAACDRLLARLDRRQRERAATEAALLEVMEMQEEPPSPELQAKRARLLQKVRAQDGDE